MKKNEDFAFQKLLVFLYFSHMIIDFFLNLIKKDPTVKRHLVKTLSWRIIGTIDTVLLGWLVTGQISLGAKIGGLELFTKMLLYFMHERVWHRMKFGIPTRIFKAENVRKANAAALFLQGSKVSRKQREELNGNGAFTIWFTGLSGSGKSSIAAEMDSWFFNNGLRAYVLDGDNTRLGINSDLTFSNEDRTENIRRVAEICKLFNESGIIVIASFISPFGEDRKMAERIIGPHYFIETFADASLQTCKDRDIKGLYLLAEQGKIKNFTGISSPYEKPLSPQIHLHTDTDSLNTCTQKLIDYLIAENRVVKAH